MKSSNENIHLQVVISQHPFTIASKRQKSVVLWTPSPKPIASFVFSLSASKVITSEQILLLFPQDTSLGSKLPWVLTLPLCAPSLSCACYLAKGCDCSSSEHRLRTLTPRAGSSQPHPSPAASPRAMTSALLHLLPPLEWGLSEFVLRRLIGRINCDNARELLSAHCPKWSVTVMNGSWGTLAGLQLVTRALGQDYPTEHSVMMDMFCSAWSNVEATSHRW